MCPVGLWKIKQQEHGIISNNTIKPEGAPAMTVNSENRYSFRSELDIKLCKTLSIPSCWRQLSRIYVDFETGPSFISHHLYNKQCIFYPLHIWHIVFIWWQQLMLIVFVLINKTPDFLFSYCKERGESLEIDNLKKFSLKKVLHTCCVCSIIRGINIKDTFWSKLQF